MVAVSLIILLIVVLVAFGAISLPIDNPAHSLSYFGAALLVLLTLVFFVAPSELGWSRAPDRAEEFSKRLEAGKMYRVVATDAVGDKGEKVVLVKELGTSGDYRTIRVNMPGRLPEKFVLVDGRPVEVGSVESSK